MFILTIDLMWNILINILLRLQSINIFGDKLDHLLMIIAAILNTSQIVEQHDKVELEMKVLKDKTQILQTEINQLKYQNKALLKITQINNMPYYPQDIDQTAKYGEASSDPLYYHPQDMITTDAKQHDLMTSKTNNYKSTFNSYKVNRRPMYDSSDDDTD